MSAGSRCPGCQVPLTFWTTFGPPWQRVRCTTCKVVSRYAGVGSLNLLFIAAWLAVGWGWFVLIGRDNPIAAVLMASLGPGPLLETPLTWHLRRRGRLELHDTGGR
jgi:hypothetical protein